MFGDKCSSLISNTFEALRLGPDKKSPIYESEFLHSRFFIALPKFVLARKPLVERQQLSTQSTFDTVVKTDATYGVQNICANEQLSS